MIYSSTNKVYGNLEHVRVVERDGRYAYEDLPDGVDESEPLDFHSPYGCSKGAGDQYVRDYARIYGLKTVVFRQSCIYGTRQFGIEDQGWIAWFCLATLTRASRSRSSATASRSATRSGSATWSTPTRRRWSGSTRSRARSSTSAAARRTR